MLKRTNRKRLFPAFLFLIILVPAAYFGIAKLMAGKTVSVTRNTMLASYGENREITGSYDASSAISCSNGTFVGLEEDGVLSFKGVPYAEQPVGALRWKEPIDAEDRTGVYEALYFGHTSIQTEWPSETASYYPQGEDCLNLNIWVNRNHDTYKKPVMVFFHGGSYGWGGTSDPVYDGHNLVKKYDDIIVVTVGYRVGIMGFIDLSVLDDTGEYAASGNLGLLDQICALRWIQKNIEAFGGDPDNVTIWGESAGAGSVSLLPLIDGTDGLFRRIIAESGSVALTYSKVECMNLTRLLLKKSGCYTMEDLLALDTDELRELNEELNDYNNFPERDGFILPYDLYEAWEDSSLSNIDMLIGTNADESRYWIQEMGYYACGIPGIMIYKHGFPVLYENNIKRLSPEEQENVSTFLALRPEEKIWGLTELYNELLFRIPASEQAVRHTESGGKSYVYYWTTGGENRTMGACHAIELSYVFNNPQATIYTGNVYDSNLADTAQDMWINFARTGDPGTEEYVWEPYTRASRMTMVLGEDIHMEGRLKEKQRRLIAPLLDNYFNGCYSQLSLGVSQIYRIAAQLMITLVLAVVIIAVICILIKRKNRS